MPAGNEKKTYRATRVLFLRVPRGRRTMRPACKKRGRPRSMGAGGRAPRYDERRTARATTKQKAPTWSDASARAVFEELQEECTLEGKGITECTRLLLLGELSDRALLMRFDRRVTPAERAVARSILDFHRTKLQKGLQDGTSTEAQAVRSFLRPLRDRSLCLPASSVEVSDDTYL